MPEIRRWIMMLGAAVSVLLLGACETKTSDKEIRLLSVGEAKVFWDRARQGKGTPAVFLDPRPTRYFDAAHIPGAWHVELHQAPLDRKRDPRLEAHSMIIVYGDHPGDVVAKAMTKRLLALEYPVVRWFAGGMKEWTERGYPVEPPPAPPPSVPGGTPPP
jgi:rhodanese-related sulfurtransferase